MSHAVLERLHAGHQALITALDANDVTAIETATAALKAAYDALGDAPLSPNDRLLAASVRELSTVVSMRVNILTDRARAKAESLAAARGRPTLVYGR